MEEEPLAFPMKNPGVWRLGLGSTGEVSESVGGKEGVRNDLLLMLEWGFAFLNLLDGIVDVGFGPGAHYQYGRFNS